jgi:prepilin-type N-terminal cleavage/methylation domain-containing protein
MTIGVQMKSSDELIGSQPSPKKGFMRRSRMRGFSLMELMIALAIIVITAGIMFMSVQPGLKQTRVTNAYNLALMTLRQARDTAVTHNGVYIVTLSTATTPNSITVTQQDTNQVMETEYLPTDICFCIVTGIPTSKTTAPYTPDQFGTAGYPVDLDVSNSAGQNIIYFWPDGSARDATGKYANGVLYLARRSDLYSSRAITLWGLTGRMRGWRLYNNSSSGTNSWSQQ